MRKHKKHIFWGILVWLWVIFALWVWEISLRFLYPVGVFDEYETQFKPANFNARYYGQILHGAHYHYFWEDIFYRNYTDPLKENPVNKEKENVAIIWDSVAQWDSWGMSEFKFAKLLKEQDTSRNYINFSQWGYNIAQEFIEYEKYVKDAGTQTIIYVFAPDDIYYSTLIWSTIYVSPIVMVPTPEWVKINFTGNETIDQELSKLYIYKFMVKQFVSMDSWNIKIWKILDESSNEEYWTHLKSRFYTFIDRMNSEMKQKHQRFIIIFSPSPNPEYAPKFQKDFRGDGNYERTKKEEAEIYARLQSQGIEMYSMSDYDVDKKDYFVDSCCHLNKAWHAFYADFIQKILDAKILKPH